MTTLNSRNGAPGVPPPLSAAPEKISRRQATDPSQQDSAAAARSAPEQLAVAVAEVLPPAGRRSLAVLLVRSCPFCRHAHVHRGEVGERRPSCGGTPYLLQVDGVIV